MKPKNSMNKPINVNFNMIRKIPKKKRVVPTALFFWKKKSNAF